MTTLLLISAMFWFASLVIISPHVSWHDAKIWPVASLAICLMFFAVSLVS